MRITTRGRYALRASLALAKLGKTGGPVSINILSERENISPIFLEQIFFKLRKSGIVRSVRGPGGGFCFAMPLEEITLRKILSAAGEELDITECDRRSVCTRDHVSDCLAHEVWENLASLIDSYFTSITIASLLAKEPSFSQKESLQLSGVNS